MNAFLLLLGIYGVLVVYVRGTGGNVWVKKIRNMRTFISTAQLFAKYRQITRTIFSSFSFVAFLQSMRNPFPASKCHVIAKIWCRKSKNKNIRNAVTFGLPVICYWFSHRVLIGDRLKSQLKKWKKEIIIEFRSKVRCGFVPIDWTASASPAGFFIAAEKTLEFIEEGVLPFHVAFIGYWREGFTLGFWVRSPVAAQEIYYIDGRVAWYTYTEITEEKMQYFFFILLLSYRFVVVFDTIYYEMSWRAGVHTESNEQANLNGIRLKLFAVIIIGRVIFT